jgi:hypothetical protein
MYRDCVTGNVRDADCSQDRKRMVVRNVKRDRRWGSSIALINEIDGGCLFGILRRPFQIESGDEVMRKR